MSQESLYPVKSGRSEMILVWDHFVGNATGQPTLPNSGKFAQVILTCTRTNVGLFTLTFKRKYPTLKMPSAYIVGATAGLRARITAIDVQAGTASITTEVGTVATDPATTDTIYLELNVRNSGRNK